MLCNVNCEPTGRRDHGQIEARWFSIQHTESIRPSNRFLNRVLPALERNPLEAVAVCAASVYRF